MKRRILSLLLCVSIVLSTANITVFAQSSESNSYGNNTSVQNDEEIHQEMVQTAEGMEIVYADDVIGSDSYDGTSTTPVETFEKALELVTDGGTIIIGENGTIAGIGNTNDTMPLVIDKEVTIKSESGGDLNVRWAGIILGADVTFEDMSLALVNKDKNAIFANGHTLTLNNVTQFSNTRQVHLFAGGLNGNTTLSGSCGTIVINGSAAQIGNIYAGAMDCTSDLPASITINGTTSMRVGAIYASGAAKGVYNADDLFSGTEPEAPEACSVNYAVGGTVTINLNNSNITSVNGATGGNENASVVISTSNLKENLSLMDIEALTIKNGEVKPAVLNSGVDVTINSGGILDLSGVMSNNSFSVSDFTGGGTLQLGKDDKLIISGTVNGSTVFQTTDGPMDKSTSGLVNLNHEYIDVSGATGADMAVFTFEPYATQTKVTLKKINNIWTTSEQTTDDIITLESFSVAETSLTVEPENINEYSDVSIGVNCTFTNSEGGEDIGSVPISYKVQYNGQTYNVAATEMQEYPGYYEGRFDALNLRFEPITLSDGSHVIYICQLSAQGAAITPGNYVITIIAPTNSGNVEQTVNLKVNGAVDINKLINITINDITYGEEPAPNGTFSGTAGSNQIWTYTYSGDGGNTYTTLEQLKDTLGHLPAGTYKIKAIYKDDIQQGEAVADFEIVRAERNAPPAFTLKFTINADDETFTAVIPAVEGGLYSFDGVNYSTVNSKTDCKSNTTYTAYVKYAQTDNYKESLAVSNTQITPKVTVKMPVFILNGTNNNGQQIVKISCGTAGATIFYTTDGSNPADGSNLGRKIYNGEFTIENNTTMSAIAVKDGMYDSAVVLADFSRIEESADTKEQDDLDEDSLNDNNMEITSTNGTAAAPATGDENLINLWCVLLMSSAVVIVMSRKRKKVML